jgi:hypothetical protein
MSIISQKTSSKKPERGEASRGRKKGRKGADGGYKVVLDIK